MFRRFGIPAVVFVFIFSITGIANAKEVIGVISILGPEAALARTGLTVFETKEKKVDLRDWNVDGYLENSYLREIKKSPNKQGITFQDKEAIEKDIQESLKFFFEGKDLTEESVGKLSSRARDLGIDKLIIITADSDSNMRRTRDVSVGGYGLHYKLGLLYTYVICNVHFLDANQEKIIISKRIQHYEEVDLLGILSDSRKQDLFSFLEENIDNKNLLKQYKAMIFAGEVTKSNRDKILTTYESENSWSEDIDEQMTALKLRVYPIHHDIEEFEIIPDDERGKIKQKLLTTVSNAAQKTFNKLFPQHDAISSTVETE